jgi:hypothetical protein
VTARYRAAGPRRPVPLPDGLAGVLARAVEHEEQAAPTPEPTGTDPNGPGTGGTGSARAGDRWARGGVFSPVSGEPV